jgi:hypothetical protein
MSLLRSLPLLPLTTSHFVHHPFGSVDSVNYAYIEGPSLNNALYQDAPKCFLRFSVPCIFWFHACFRNPQFADFKHAQISYTHGFQTRTDFKHAQISNTHGFQTRTDFKHAQISNMHGF